jgi:hypothetical protein
VTYLPDESDAENRQFAFAYTITIKNTGQTPAQLIARHWIITDGDEGVEEVKGLGVVGQQPFGGARASGTDDKAGHMINLLRWVAPRTIKELFVPPTDYRYPFLKQDKK